MKPPSSPTRACRRPTTCGSTFPIPAPESRPTSSTRFSSRSSRPRRSARAPGLVSRRCTASSSRPAASSMSTPRPARAPRSASSCRVIGPNWKRSRSRRPPTARARAAAEPPKPRPDLTGQGTILLVEDEDGLRSLNARGLRSRGYSVIEASNGIEAMEALDEKDGAVDLVVSDVVMPEMDGPTLLREMRKRNPEPQDHLRLRLCRRSLRQEPAGERAIRLPAETVRAQRAGREGQGDHDGVVNRGRLSGSRGVAGMYRQRSP